MQGAQVLGLMTMGMRNIYCKKEIKSVDDVKGEKIRVQATKTEDTHFPAYGDADRAHAVRRGLHLAADRRRQRRPRTASTSTSRTSTTRWRRSCRMTEHEANNNCIWVSDKTWNSLSDQEKSWVQAAADEVGQDRSRAMALKLEKDSAEQLKKMGVKVVDGRSTSPAS